MKIAITQRIDFVENYNEKRDALDVKWTDFILSFGGFPVPLPTLPSHQIQNYLNKINFDGLILSGGNSIASTNANDAEITRDEFEFELITYCIKQSIPVVGVCRGMQILNVYSKGQLSPLENHVGGYHKLISKNTQFTFSNKVNSFHSWGILQNNLAKNFNVLATDTTGNIEAIFDKEKRLLGVMWHPERENPFSAHDITLFQDFFNEN